MIYQSYRNYGEGLINWMSVKSSDGKRSRPFVVSLVNVLVKTWVVKYMSIVHNKDSYV